MRKYIVGLLTVVCMTIGMLCMPTAPADAQASQTFRIARTEIGIRFRTNPNDWNSAAGPAGYDGDWVTLHCVREGTAVGPYNNRMWYQATTATGSGWLPDRYTTTPINANEWLPNLSKCDQPAPAAAPTPASQSVFFSPNETPGGQDGLNPGTTNLKLSQWAGGEGCSADNVMSSVPANTTTIAGWSRGRMGVVYFLTKATPRQMQQLDTIVLFDPGSARNFEDRWVISWDPHQEACDDNYDINGLLANWLKSEREKRLIVVTGHDSEMYEFAGLWDHYFAGIWALDDDISAARARVCDYTNMDHYVLMRQFAGMVKSPPDSCPRGVGNQDAVKGAQGWHP
ncbi:MAG TPA: hypothetical protein VK694_01345 [Verrucomicrobiae bacterium]|nr:hypothetical protein [Verrucomicrobiae bacterium]